MDQIVLTNRITNTIGNVILMNPDFIVCQLAPLETRMLPFCVNTFPPNTEKWLRKFYMKTMAT